MRKQAEDFPAFFTWESFAANSSLLRSLPSGVNTHSQAPLGTAAKMASASLESPAAISAGEGFSGRRYSGSSRSLKRQ